MERGELEEQLRAATELGQSLARENNELRILLQQERARKPQDPQDRLVQKQFQEQDEAKVLD